MPYLTAALVTTEEDLIQKEEVGTLHFPATDVLPTIEDRRRRTHAIERACTLGNAHHGKVLIHFMTEDGHQYRIDTTIWACDDRFITLKAGASLPVRAVTEIEFI
jgi:hypothetical protein